MIDGELIAEPGTGTEGFDVDAAFASIEATGDAGQSPTPPTREAAPAPAPQTPYEIDFTWNGKQIKVPANDPKARQWASQGYDYAQRMAQFAAERQAFDARQKQIAEIENRYKPIEDYVKENPSFWDHVLTEWNGRQARAATSTNDPVAKELSALKNEISEVKQFKQIIETERQQQIYKTQDQELDQEIKSIQETYPDLDLKAIDPSTGKSLEYRVYEFGVQKGIRSFKDAFELFNHQHLIKRAEERGKETITKDIQKQTRLGLLGKTSTPMKGVQPTQNVRSKSYDQLFEESLQELRG